MTLPVNFGGIVPPLVTPLTERYDVDVPSLERLIEFQVSAGIHGLFVLGSSSESAYLTNKQRATVIEVTVKTVAGRVPVLAGAIDMATARVIEHAQAAEAAGVDALVVTAPFYAVVEQAEIVAHFRFVRAAVQLPIFAYDIPRSVPTRPSRQTILTLAREQVIQGLKDSSGDEANFRALVLAKKELPDFKLFTGSELVVDFVLSAGANGAVSGLSNVDPAGYVRLYNAAMAGDWQTARAEQERLFHLYDIAKTGLGRTGFNASAIGGYKTALQLRGILDTNVPGQPLLRLNAAETAQIRQKLIAADLLS